MEERYTNSPIYPEAIIDWDPAGGSRGIWVTWPDGRKEFVYSLYSDDSVTNGTDRFYVILSNGDEQTIVVKDEKFLELKKISKETREIREEKLNRLLEIKKRKVFKKKIVIFSSFFVLLSVPFILIRIYNKRRGRI